MKLFVYGPDLSVPQPVWMSIFWPHYKAISQSVPAVFLAMPLVEHHAGRFRRKLTKLAKRRERAVELESRVRDHLDWKGPNVLLVYALNGSDVDNSHLLDEIWDEFDFRVLNVVDTLQPTHTPNESFTRFDLILSFCPDLAADFQDRTGVRSLHFPPHCDVLGYCSLREQRPIDLILVGRRDPDRHAPLHRHFNAPERDWLFLDFVTRTQNQPLAEEEFGLLMATYSRSKAAFCYEPGDVERFRGRSPLTGRWVHAWASGCTVIGTKPTSRAVAEEMDWPQSAIELPDETQAAIEAIEAVLGDDDGLSRRRKRNVIEAPRRHDTRLRLRTLFAELDIPPTEELSEGLDCLRSAADSISRAG